MRSKVCACCGKTIKNIFDRHTPEPVFQEPGAVVCPKCYKTIVVPARKNILRNGTEETFKEFFDLKTDKERFWFLKERKMF